MAPGRMDGSKPLAAHPDWWPDMAAPWPMPNCDMDACWLLWWLLSEGGGGVLQTAVSASDQILGLLGGMGMPDLPSSTVELLPALLLRWCDR
jgi:hypothetical protein